MVFDLEKMRKTRTQINTLYSKLAENNKAIVWDEFDRLFSRSPDSLCHQFYQALYSPKLNTGLHEIFRRQVWKSWNYTVFRDPRLMPFSCGKVPIAYLTDKSRQCLETDHQETIDLGKQAKTAYEKITNKKSMEAYRLAAEISLVEDGPPKEAYLIRTMGAMLFVTNILPLDSGYDFMRETSLLIDRGDILLDFLTAVDNLDDYTRFANDDHDGGTRDWSSSFIFTDERFKPGFST
jgi:hypothetical protein